MEWNASLPCSDTNGLLQVVAIAMHQPVNAGSVVSPLARHLGLAVKPEVDSARDSNEEREPGKAPGAPEAVSDPVLGREFGRLAQERLSMQAEEINLSPPDHRRLSRWLSSIVGRRGAG